MNMQYFNYFVSIHCHVVYKCVDYSLFCLTTDYNIMTKCFESWFVWVPQRLIGLR